MQAKYKYKPVTEVEHLLEIVKLQDAVWGDEVVTSLPQLVAAVHNGGVVIGAWHKERIIGFCYGFAGIEKIGEKPYLCSHMMAIAPQYRNQGIGEQLKWKQREWAITFGYEKMTWTYDPLEVRNGYLNLCKLGAYVKTYIESYYGDMKDKVNNGVPSDRFLVEWDLLSFSVQQASKGIRKNKSDWKTYERLLNYDFKGNHLVPVSHIVKGNGKGYLLPVPKNNQQLKAESLELAQDWRMALREVVKSYIADGYRVEGCIPEKDVGFYVLEQYSKDESIAETAQDD